MKDKIGKLPAGLALFINVILGMIPLYIHVWTLLIAILHGRIILAVIGLFLPVISWFYWFAVVWTEKGTFLNPYCLMIILSLLFFITGVIKIELSAYFSRRKASRQTGPE